MTTIKELEEASKEFYPPTTTDLICSPKLVRDAFIAGAKWQAERMYSEEEVKQAYLDGCRIKLTCHLSPWFENFKKK